MSDTWQTRRSRFSHDWLKNRYLPALSKWINVLDELVDDPGFEREFLEAIFPQWGNQWEDALAIIEAFSIEMSPKILMNNPIFHPMRTETRKWLTPLIHQLWLNRWPVVECQKAAVDAVMEATACYERLRSIIPLRKEVEPDYGLLMLDRADLVEQFNDFRARCLTVARCVEAFAAKVQAI